MMMVLTITFNEEAFPDMYVYRQTGLKSHTEPDCLKTMVDQCRQMGYMDPQEILRLQNATQLWQRKIQLRCMSFAFVLSYVYTCTWKDRGGCARGRQRLRGGGGEGGRQGCRESGRGRQGCRERGGEREAGM